MALRTKVCEIIRDRPDITTSAMSLLIYGTDGGRPQIERICRDLVQEGRLRRRGLGGRRDPYTYEWIDRPRSATGPPAIADAVPI